MSLHEQIEKLRAIRRQADALFLELEALAKAGRKVPRATLSRLSKLVAHLEEAAREAARSRRREIIGELTGRIGQYDTLLALDLSPAVRAAVEAERATLVAQRGYHRGRLGLDFEGIVGSDEVDKLAALIAEVRAAAATKQRAAEYIDGVIRIGIAAAGIIARIAT